MPDGDQARPRVTALARDFFAVFTAFLRKKEIASILAFLLLYRFGEAQLLKLAAPFLLDTTASGGLALSTQQVGIVYGTVGILCLTCGGLLGGYVISLHGLKRWLWPMVLSVNVPHLVYVYLSQVLPTNVWQIGFAVGLEQFGYGFGFAAYLLYMIMISDGPNKTAHYTICTGFMALGMMLPGMVSGWIQTQLGYASFFIWICISAVPAFAATALIRVAPEFGKKKVVSL
jgi:PAT family beta-lactamase induction signal transducer AmpG